MIDRNVGTTFDPAWNIEHDLSDIVQATENIWKGLNGAALFLTGGTGFIGTWLLESMKWANQELNLGLRATILTRNKDRFRNKAPHLVDYQFFTFIEGDVRTFSSPKGDFTHVIHAATEARLTLIETDPRQMFDTIVNGTLRVLDFAVEKRCEKVLYLSSGAIYGTQPEDLCRISEDQIGSIDCSNPNYSYAEGKRGAEMLCAVFGKQFSLQIAIARIFAVVGPHLPLDEHFVIGNFIRDAINGRAITVIGSGSPVRSYLYISDLVIWLWKLLVDGRAGIPYNIGSENEISVRSLAEMVSSVIGDGEFGIQGKNDIGINPSRYVPDTNRIRNEFRLQERVALPESIRRTALWNEPRGSA